MAGRLTVISTTAYVPGSVTGGAPYFSTTGQKITPGWVTLQTIDSKFRLHERLGRAPTRVVGGYGDWDMLDRPKRRSITSYKGRTPLRVQSSIMFDAFKSGRSVEDRIREFEKMAGLDIDRNGVEVQPSLLLRFDNGPHDNNRASQNRWVIEADIQWDLEEWNGDGDRTRAEATFVYLEYTNEQVYRSTGTQKNARSTRSDRSTATKRSTTKHTVKAGETLSTIAADLYDGDRNAWTLLAAANGLRDPNSVRPGDVLDLP